jgi:hypothetical protein
MLIKDEGDEVYVCRTIFFKAKPILRFERKDTSPCGIALQANNSTSVGSVFHGASRKGAKGAKFEKDILTADSRRPASSKAQSAWRKASRKYRRFTENDYSRKGGKGAKFR